MRRSAFTLIELIVALTIGGIILTSAVAIAVTAQEQATASRRRSHLARVGAFLQHQLSFDLRHAGLGVPQGPFHNGPLGGTAGRFNGSILLAGADFIGVVGDVPRPDADFAAFGSLAAIPAGPERFSWYTDNSGVCIPKTTPGGCSTATESRLLPGVAGCNALGRGRDDTCPWGLRRLLAGEAFTVVAGDGSWAIARMPGDLSAALVVGPDDHLVFESASSDAEWNRNRWKNTDPRVDGPAAVRGQGFISSVDRIFYFRDGKTIRRVQCYGTPDPENPGFPPASATAMPSLNQLRYVPSSGGAAAFCTPPEIVADHVDTLRFDYVDAEGNALVPPLGANDKRLVRGVRWQATFVDDANPRQPVDDAVEGAVALRNLP